MVCRYRDGFTLIELLTALAILSILTVAVADLFTHSSAAWETGTRRANSMLVGRALTDYFVRETSMALGGPYAPDTSGFTILKGTSAMEDKEFVLTDLIGNTTALSAAGPSPNFSDPRLVTFEVTVTVEDKGRSVARIHTGRAFVWNHNRYEFD